MLIGRAERHGSSDASKNTSHHSSSIASTSTSLNTLVSTSASSVVHSTTPRLVNTQKSTNKLPLGVVAGSVAGGMVLGILAVLAWTYWGNAVRNKQRRQVLAALTTRDTQSSSSRFDGREKHGREVAPKGFSPEVGKKGGRRTLQKTRRGPKPITEQKKRLKPVAENFSEDCNVSTSSNLTNVYIETPLTLPPTITHKPSTLGSASVYSTQSGEERQYTVPPNSPFAFSNHGVSSTHNWVGVNRKPSNVSSLYSDQSGEERLLGIPTQVLATLGHDPKRLSAWTRSFGSLSSIATERQLRPTGKVRLTGRQASGVGSFRPGRLSQASASSLYTHIKGPMVGTRSERDEKS